MQKPTHSPTCPHNAAFRPAPPNIDAFTGNVPCECTFEKALQCKGRNGSGIDKFEALGETLLTIPEKKGDGSIDDSEFHLKKVIFADGLEALEETSDQEHVAFLFKHKQLFQKNPGAPPSKHYAANLPVRERSLLVRLKIRVNEDSSTVSSVSARPHTQG